MVRRAAPGGQGQPPSHGGSGTLRLVFAGTPQAALPSLRALLDSDHDIVAVVTRPDAPAGRGRRLRASPVAELARERDVPVLTPLRPSEPDFLATLADLAPDCCPIVAYGGLVPPAALAIPKHGWVNLHFSLLPAWRGAAPVQRAIMAGDDLTGASTFALEAGLDTGPVFGVVTEPVGPADTAGVLLARLADSGARLLLATMDGIASGDAVAVPQPADGISLAPKVTVEEARVDWSRPALLVDRRIRGCTPDPGPWTTFRDQRLKLGPVEPVDGQLGPGDLLVERHRVLVGTATTPLALGEVQPQGKRAMPALDWARGLRPQPGDRMA